MRAGQEKGERTMGKFWTCPDCGANLDPGERCDCRENVAESRKSAAWLVEEELGTGQYALVTGGSGDEIYCKLERRKRQCRKYHIGT